MTKHLYKLLVGLLLAAWLPLAATAQAPGWGWVKLPSDNTYSTFGENNTAGVGRDDAGNIYLAGGYKGMPTFGSTSATNQGGSEAYLAKYDPSGNLLWMKAMHGTAGDAITKITVMPNGRCLLSGYFGNGPTGGNLSFAEFGSSLVLPGPQQLGLLTSGPPSQLVYFGMPFLMAVEPDGSLAWAISPSVTNNVESKELAYDAQGNVYLAATSKYGLKVNGITYPAIGDNDAVLLKCNASGQMQWAQQIGTATKVSGSYNVKVDNSGNVYWMVGHATSFSLAQLAVPYGGGSTLVKLSPTNHVKWAKNGLVMLNSQPTFLELAGFDPAGTLYFSFQTPSSSTLTFNAPSSPLVTPGNGQTAMYTSYAMKCDTAAQINWVKQVWGMTAPTGTSSGISGGPLLLPSANGFTLVTYTAQGGQSTFAGSPVTYGAADGGLVCVIRYNTSTDQTEWVRVGGTVYGTLSNSSRAGTFVNGAVQDLTGNMHIAGTYYGPAQFGTNTLGLTGGQYGIYLAKLDQTVLAAKAAAAGKAWHVYPNPASSAVQLDGLPARTTVRVLDALGREVRSTQAAALDLTGLAPGLYLLQATGTTELYQPQRLLVQ